MVFHGQLLLHIGEISSILFIFTTACAAVIHDVAVARYYRLIISRKLPSLSSVYSVFLLVAIVIGMGLPLMLAGNLEVLNRVVESSWVTTFYFLAITFLLLFYLPCYRIATSTR